MIEFTVKEVAIGGFKQSIQDAIDSILSDTIVKSIHGNTTEISPWKHNKREIRYSHDVSNVSHPFKKFVIKDTIWVTAQQNLHVDPTINEARVENKVKLRCVGSSFISIDSIFKIQRCNKTDNYMFEAKVRVNVALPGIANMTEHLLVDQAKDEVTRLVQAIKCKETRV